LVKGAGKPWGKNPQRKKLGIAQACTAEPTKMNKKETWGGKKLKKQLDKNGKKVLQSGTRFMPSR